MKVISSTSRRMLRQKWLYISAAATILCLWLDLGTETHVLSYGPEIKDLLSTALSGTGSSLSLPFLAALPFSSNAWQEMENRAAYFSVFRCGYRRYLIGQLFTLQLAACLSQLLGIVFFGLLLIVFGASWSIPEPKVSLLLLYRLLAAISFANLGCMGALITKDTICALVIPIATSFSLALLADRFFSGRLGALTILVPSLGNEFTLTSWMVPILCILANGFLLNWEVHHHA